MSEESTSDLIVETYKKLKPHNVFLVLALVAGVSLVFITGPFQANDEVTHFRRAYQISQGQIISKKQGDWVGGYLPKTVDTANVPFDEVLYHPEIRINREALSEKLREPLNPEEQTFSHFLMPAVYAPTLYIPQAVGIAIGRFAGLSALRTLYFGRLFNVLWYVAIVYAAIRITPVLNWLFMLVGLLPMNIALAASLSADASINASAILLIALVMRITLENRSPIQEWHRVVLIVLCVFLAFGKQVYFPLTWLVFLIPAKKFSSVRGKLVFCFAVVGASLLASLFWSAVTKGLFVTFIRGNAPEQIKYLASHPFIFPKIMYESISEQWQTCSFSWIGLLGFLDTWLPKWIYWSYPFVLILAALLDKGQAGRLGWYEKIWIACIILSVFILIDLSLYIIWTPPGADTVHGVQGRYILPLVIPVLFILYGHNLFELPDMSWGPLACTGYSIAVLIATCLTVYARFYGSPAG